MARIIYFTSATIQSDRYPLFDALNGLSCCGISRSQSYRRPPCIWYGLRRRQETISEEAKEIAWKAQYRLHKRYMKLNATGKTQGKVITAVARELLGFIWAIGTRAERIASQQAAA